MRTSSWILSVVVLLASVVAAPVARAENPNQVFAGRIMVSDKKFPTTAKSPSAYVAAIRKQAKTTFPEAKDDKGHWKIYFVAFLKSKLDDLEYLVKIYDNSGRQKQLLTSFEQFTNDRGQQQLAGNFSIDKQQVGVNKELLVTIEFKNKVLASGTFRPMGEGEHYSGKVDFSDEDTKKKDDE